MAEEAGYVRQRNQTGVRVMKGVIKSEDDYFEDW